MKQTCVALFGLLCHVSLASSWVSVRESRAKRLSHHSRGDNDWTWGSSSNNNPQVWPQKGSNSGWQQPTGQSSNKGTTSVQSWPSQSKDDDVPDSWQEWGPQQPKNLKGSAHSGGGGRGGAGGGGGAGIGAGGGEEPLEGKLEDILRGVPGEDFPNYDAIPDTDFDCGSQQTRGYYGDVEAGCQVFHICQPEGRKDSFLCPVGTIFNQKYFVCDWWFNVNCSDTPSYYDLNAEVYKEEEPKEVVAPQVTTPKPSIKTASGGGGGGRGKAPGGWDAPSAAGPSVGPSKPASGWSVKGSSSGSWSQSSSSQGSSSSSWSGSSGGRGQSKGYGGSQSKPKAGRGKTNGAPARLSNIKQIKNQAWISLGSSNYQAQNKPNSYQTKVIRNDNSFINSFGSRMKSANPSGTTVAPGIWTPTSIAGIEPTTLRRGIAKYGSQDSRWFGNINEQRNPKLQTNTQATSIIPTEIKGVWEQETVHQPWLQNEDYNDDYDVEISRNSVQGPRGDDEEYTDASTPGREYVDDDNTQWSTTSKDSDFEWTDASTAINFPEFRLLDKQNPILSRRDSDAYQLDYSLRKLNNNSTNNDNNFSNVNINQSHSSPTSKPKDYVTFGTRLHPTRVTRTNARL